MVRHFIITYFLAFGEHCINASFHSADPILPIPAILEPDLRRGQGRKNGSVLARADFDRLHWFWISANVLILAHFNSEWLPFWVGGFDSRTKYIFVEATSWKWIARCSILCR